jgi:hypothetical protein
LQLFRNSFQNSSIPLLESVFKYLIKENNKILTDTERKEGAERISALLTDESSLDN